MFLIQVAQAAHDVHDIHAAHEAFDLSFNLGHVITICLGVGSIIGLYFKMKSDIEKVKSESESKIDKVEFKGEADLALSNLRIESIEKGLKDTKREVDQLEKNIGNKLDEVSKGLHAMAIGFANFKAEITKYIYKDNKH